MPSKHIRTNVPPSVTGGGSTTTLDAFTDTFSLKMTLTDSNAVPTDADTYQITLTQADTNADLSETLQLQFPAPDFSDTQAAPTDSNSFTARIWLSASAGGTNPTNADGVNNATIATLQTAAAGAATITLTSTLGANVPSGINVAAAIYRGWFKSVNTLVTSTGSLILHSTSALFADKVMFSNAALNATVDHLTGDFTYDLVANGVDTFAKIASAQMLHRVVDAVAGITPHVLTVDAGCIELAAAFSGGVVTTNQLSIGDASASESAGTVTITITRSSPDGTTTTVNYATSDRTTAISGDDAIVVTDYTSTSGVATFTGVQTTQTFTVPLINNAYIEPDRTFIVTLSSPVNGTIADGTASITITDDEAAKTYLQDYSGNARDLTAGSAPPASRACTAAKFANGRDWTVVANQALTRVDSAFNLLGDLSITCVFDLDTIGGVAERGLFRYGSAVNLGNNTACAFSCVSSSASTGSNVFQFHNVGTTPATFSSPNIGAGAHTLTIVRNNTAKTVLVKIDGVTVINTTYTGSPNNADNTGFVIGGRFDQTLNSSHDGGIYDLRIWNAVVAQATLDAIVASSGKCAPEGTEFAWYRLEDT